MKCYCLASSSQGNCFIFDFDVNGVSTKILVECGIPYHEILKKCNELGIDFSDIQACLITHAHQDHCKSAKELYKRKIPIIDHNKTLEQLNIKGQGIMPKQKFRVANCLFGMAIDVEHDIEGSVGYILKTDKECVIFIIDHKRFKTNIQNFKPNSVFIECNYDHKVFYAQYYELKKRKEEIGFEDSEMIEINTKLKQMERNINSHASIISTEKGLSKMDLSNCRGIFLTHLSDRWANEYKMKNEIQSIFGVKTYVCSRNGGIK